MNVQEIDGYHDGSVRGYLAVLSRQKLIFVLAVVLVPVVAVAISMSQKASYEASAQVLTGNSAADADRVAQTEVSVARVPIVAARTLRAARISRLTSADLLAHSTVTAKANANVLDFTVTDPDPSAAQRLVNAYVREFTAYRAALDAAPLTLALRDIRSKIARVQREGGDSKLVAALRAKARQLETTQQVQGSDVRVLRTASRATQISPRPKLYLVLGVILGLVLGAGLAVLADALDKRVRSPDEVVDGLGLPLLGLVPCRSRGSDRPGLAMLNDPDGAEADAVRMLKTKLVLANLSHRAHIIMFVSATADDGKLRVLANLAVSLARGHRRVVAVDFDLRESKFEGLLGVPGPRGLTDVASGAASLEEALVRVDVNRVAAGTSNRSQRGGRPVAESRNVVHGTAKKLRAVSALDTGGEGGLQILGAGSPSSRNAELVETQVVPELLEGLRMRSDLVLVNAPPLLRAGDAIMLATMVDAMVVVASTRHTRRTDLGELRRLLDAVPVPKLGVVLTDASENATTGWTAGDLSRQRTVGAPPAVSARSSDVQAST